MLKPGGLLAFSSHNRDIKVPSAYPYKQLSLSIKPHRMLRHIGRYIGGIL